MLSKIIWRKVLKVLNQTHNSLFEKSTTYYQYTQHQHLEKFENCVT